MSTSVRARPSLPSLKSIYLSPQYRTFRTSSLRLARPSISSIGPVQPTAYVNALDALYAELADLYPNGRAKYKPSQIPAQCPPLPVRKKIETSYNIATTKGRCSLIDMDTAREFVRGALAIGEGKGGGRKERKEGRVIIEAFPGPGAITRALLELPRSEVKRVIVLEEELKYLRLLKELEYYDDRVHVLPSSGFIWETYDEIRDLGLLDDISAENWKPTLHSTLSFIGHLPLGPVGEQLIAQLFRSIPERSWLFKYGRMRMSWLLSKRMLDRIECPPKRASRCKLTVIAEATAELTRVMPDEALADYNWLFVPRSDPTSLGKKTPLARRMGQPFVALNIDPLAEGAIMDRMEANELIAQAVINSSGSRSTSSTSKKAKDEVKRMIEEPGVQDVLDEADAKGLIKGASARKGVKQKESHHTVMSDLTEVVPVPTKEGARVTLAKWDYVLRQLFILKSTPLEKSIQNLGAGASILLSKLTGPDVPEERRVNIKLPINALTVQDFARIVEEFDRWPFAPDVLFIADLGDEARN